MKNQVTKPRHVTMIEDLLARGMTVPEVATRLDVSWWTVYRWSRGGGIQRGNLRRLERLHAMN